MTIEPQYDFINSAIGLEISNGYDERPLIHFEDFSENLVFKIQGNTDFDKGYSYGLNVGWENIRYISLIAIEFYDCNYLNRNLDFQDLNISAKTFINKINLNVKLKLGRQNLNSQKNIGTELRISKLFIYQKLYAGLSSGYYFDYFTYSGFIKSFVFKDTIGMRLTYQKIDKYDFLNVGLNFTFTR